MKRKDDKGKRVGKSRDDGDDQAALAGSPTIDPLGDSDESATLSQVMRSVTRGHQRHDALDRRVEALEGLVDGVGTALDRYRSNGIHSARRGSLRNPGRSTLNPDLQPRAAPPTTRANPSGNTQKRTEVDPYDLAFGGMMTLNTFIREFRNGNASPRAVDVLRKLICAGHHQKQPQPGEHSKGDSGCCQSQLPCCSNCTCGCQASDDPEMVKGREGHEKDHGDSHKAEQRKRRQLEREGGGTSIGANVGSGDGGRSTRAVLVAGERQIELRSTDEASPAVAAPTDQGPAPQTTDGTLRLDPGLVRAFADTLEANKTNKKLPKGYAEAEGSESEKEIGVSKIDTGNIMKGPRTRGSKTPAPTGDLRTDIAQTIDHIMAPTQPKKNAAGRGGKNKASRQNSNSAAMPDPSVGRENAPGPASQPPTADSAPETAPTPQPGPAPAPAPAPQPGPAPAPDSAQAPRPARGGSRPYTIHGQGVVSRDFNRRNVDGRRVLQNSAEHDYSTISDPEEPGMPLLREPEGYTWARGPKPADEDEDEEEVEEEAEDEEDEEHEEEDEGREDHDTDHNSNASGGANGSPKRKSDDDGDSPSPSKKSRRSDNNDSNAEEEDDQGSRDEEADEDAGSYNGDSDADYQDRIAAIVCERNRGESAIFDFYLARLARGSDAAGVEDDEDAGESDDGSQKRISSEEYDSPSPSTGTLWGRKLSTAPIMSRSTTRRPYAERFHAAFQDRDKEGESEEQDEGEKEEGLDMQEEQAGGGKSDADGSGNGSVKSSPESGSQALKRESDGEGKREETGGSPVKKAKKTGRNLLGYDFPRQKAAKK